MAYLMELNYIYVTHSRKIAMSSYNRICDVICDENNRTAV